MKNLHIGSFLKKLAVKHRMSPPQIEEKINMSAQGVREIFKREDVHVKNIEDFANLFNVDIFEILSKNWRGEKVEVEEVKPISTFDEDSGPYTVQKKSPISVTFEVDPEKREQLIQLLMS